MKQVLGLIVLTLLICSLAASVCAEDNTPGKQAPLPSLLPTAPQTIPVSAQKPLEAESAQQHMRLGHVDVARIAAESATAKDGQAQVAELKNKLQKQIEAKKKQLEKQKTAIEAKLKTMTTQQREAKAKEFQKKVEDLQKFIVNAEKELQARQEELSEKLFKAVEQASAELGKAKGLALVIVKRELLYLGSGVDARDVTDDVITLIDGKEPKK